MIDEAFSGFGAMLAELLSFDHEVKDDEQGVRSRITRCELEVPLELSVARNAGGALQIGSVPPLYGVRTSFLPSFHRLRVVAEEPPATDEEARDGE